ncbi:Repetin [Streptomyces sp. CAU 1734]|uniref:Repetin n=1 Tax=Streptomyces sp. CAU 1734 TaxID=3140360 RepID=UPI003260C4F4
MKKIAATLPRRTKLAALGVALLLASVATGGATAAGPEWDPGAEPAPAAVPAAAAPEQPREAAALTGKAKLYRSKGDDITFSFDARLAAEHTADPLKATGTFRFEHYVNGRGAWAEARVDCLLTGGKVAVVSGVITATDLKGAKGKRVGVTVHDLAGGDRLGYSWAASDPTGRHLPPCVSSAPYEKVLKGTGNFTVVPWRPAL